MIVTSLPRKRGIVLLLLVLEGLARLFPHVTIETRHKFRSSVIVTVTK